MVHIFVESYDLQADYLRAAMGRYIKPSDHVAVVAFSFRDTQVRNREDWDALYSPKHGRYYEGIVQPLRGYGIPDENVEFVNYFTDTPESAAEKLRRADIVYLLGGLMDKTVERIDAFGLRPALQAHRGVVLGFSAGALVQLAEYHVSPDDDYPEFGYYAGLSLLDGFYLEVHYEGNPVQQSSIARVLKERGKPVYALADGRGAIIIDGGEMRLLGDVKAFVPGGGI